MSKSVDDEASFAHLTGQERELLKAQLDSPSVKVSWFGLYRYADSWDLVVTAISLLCAIAAGAALPLLSVSPLRQQ